MRVMIFAGMLAICAIAPCANVRAACPGNTQFEMNQCAGARFQAAERRMNAAYQQLESEVGLSKAQSAFMAYRDAQCGYEAEKFSGGSMQPMMIATCLYELTNARAILLEHIAKE